MTLFSLTAKVLAVFHCGLSSCWRGVEVEGELIMWRRRPSQSDPTLPASNPAYAYPYSSHASNSFNMTRRGPLDAPPGHRLTRRVTWRSFTYKIVAYLYLLGILYIVWLLRDIFTMPFSSSPPPFSARSSGKPSLEE